MARFWAFNSLINTRIQNINLYLGQYGDREGTVLLLRIKGVILPIEDNSSFSHRITDSCNMILRKSMDTHIVQSPYLQYTVQYEYQSHSLQSK